MVYTIMRLVAGPVVVMLLLLQKGPSQGRANAAALAQVPAPAPASAPVPAPAPAPVPVPVPVPAPVPSADTYLADLRIFSAPDCQAGNLGVATITLSQAGQCRRYGAAFESIYAHVSDGWILRAHKQAYCADEGDVIRPSPRGASSNSTGLLCHDVAAPGTWIAVSVQPQFPK